MGMSVRSLIRCSHLLRGGRPARLSSAAAGVPILTLMLWTVAGCEEGRVASTSEPPAPAVIAAEETQSAPISATPEAQATVTTRPAAGRTSAADTPSPAEKAALAAETRPAASGVPPFTPLENAAAGEWTFYEGLAGRTLRYEVVRAGAAYVDTRVEITDRGKPLGLPATRSDRRDFDPLADQAHHEGVQRTTRRATVRAAGRSWEATLYEDRWIDEDLEHVRRSWVCADAPVFGLIRMELTAGGELEAQLELTSFGSPGKDQEGRRPE